MKITTFTERTNTARIDIKTEDETSVLDTVEVVYRPATWTPEFEDRLRPKDGEVWSSTIFARALSEAVVRWDLTEDLIDTDGIKAVEVPRTPERLSLLPTSLLSQIIGGISTDMSPKAKPKPNSASGT